MSSIKLCKECGSTYMEKENAGFFVHGEEGGFWDLLGMTIRFLIYIGVIYLFVHLFNLNLTIYSESQGNIFHIS